MANKETTACLKNRYERAVSRKYPGPSYMAMDSQFKRHKEYVLNRYAEIKARKMPEGARLSLKELEEIDNRRRHAVKVWAKLIASHKFRQTANHDWVASVETFLEDVGLPPSITSALRKSNIHIKYTGSTCHWTRGRQS